MNFKERGRLVHDNSKIKDHYSTIESTYKYIQDVLNTCIDIISNDKDYPTDFDIHASLRAISRSHKLLKDTLTKLDNEVFYLMKDIKRAVDSYLIQKEEAKIHPLQDIARYFLYHYSKFNQGVSDSKLHCLCFLTEGIYRASYCLPLTGETFVAHKDHPIGRQLQKLLRSFPRNNEENMKSYQNIRTNLPHIAKILDFVTEITTNLMEFEIPAFIRNHSPWIIARDGVANYEEFGQEIDPYIMGEYYQRFMSYYAKNRPAKFTSLKDRKQDLKSILISEM